MMSVKEYALDTNHSVAQILKKCQELGINVKNADDQLSEDDIIILDNTINLISTNSDATLDELDYIEEDVEELVEANNLDRNFGNNSSKKQKLKKKSQLQSSKDEYMSKRKEMYKHKEKLMQNKSSEENIVLYKEGMTVQELAEGIGVDGTELVKKLLSFNNLIKSKIFGCFSIYCSLNKTRNSKYVREGYDNGLKSDKYTK